MSRLLVLLCPKTFADLLRDFGEDTVRLSKTTIIEIAAQSRSWLTGTCDPKTIRALFGHRRGIIIAAKG
jgi:hypothetical protein